MSLMTTAHNHLEEHHLPRDILFLSHPQYPATPPTEACSDEEHCNSIEELSPLSPNPIVAIIGVGYVGEHLVSTFSRAYRVIGYDVSPARVEHLRNLFESTPLVEMTRHDHHLASATHFLVSVPTLLRADSTIDTSYLGEAIRTIAKWARQGSTIIIESSVAVGMTRSLLAQLATDRGFLVGMSPERVDPGRTDPTPHAIPKIVSGLDDVAPGSLDAIAQLYSAVFDTVVRVSRPEVAEMMKLYENCQRMMCIAFANEMADACVPHAIDPYEVCRAAATKPFGYMPFDPSLGVGGHCIPVNPYYLLSNSEFPLLRAATEKMQARPGAVAQRVIKSLATGRLSNPNSSWPNSSRPKPRVLVVGMGFKRGQAHLVNSPGFRLAETLEQSQEVDVVWADPLVKQEAIPLIERLDETRDWNPASLQQSFDYIVVALKQHGLDFGVLDGIEKNVVKVDMWCA
ncbi:polysaccharide biosynthesis protein vipA/tviB [Plectosphaerella plurivora]|uniref:Polysaccharide biosynthesis protein vipA/tviB n=1 Tax=Plectosphaerella plurivora TaxID=936078 RepID=A0A9P8V3B3_9PEZI|nr:polysaccharide biosynthesis protein vipA/tviB [Plectosphaerella plurivora]